MRTVPRVLLWFALSFGLYSCAGRGAAPNRPAAPGAPLSPAERGQLLRQAGEVLRARPERPTDLRAVQRRLQQALTPTPAEFALVSAYADVSDRLGAHLAAETQIGVWRDRTAAPLVESVLTLWLAQRHARAGRLDAAAAQLRRHIRTGSAVDATSYTWAGTVALAQTQLPEAAALFTQALYMGRGTREGPSTPRALAQAGYGLALVRDLQGEVGAVDEALALGAIFDGGDALAKAACDARLEVPVLGGAEALYLCALMGARLGRAAGEAYASFSNVDVQALPEPWRDRARVWQQLAKRRTLESSGSALRLLAVVTTRTDGPWPAILLDVAWRQRDAFKACLTSAPAAGLQRLAFRLRLSPEGEALETVALPGPEAWHAVGQCFANRLAALVSLPPAAPVDGPPGDTLAIVEVLVTSP